MWFCDTSDVTDKSKSDSVSRLQVFHPCKDYCGAGTAGVYEWTNVLVAVWVGTAVSPASFQPVCPVGMLAVAACQVRVCYVTAYTCTAYGANVPFSLDSG